MMKAIHTVYLLAAAALFASCGGSDGIAPSPLPSQGTGGTGNGGDGQGGQGQQGGAPGDGGWAGDAGDSGEPPPPPDVEHGLVVSYPFAGDANDASGNSQHGTNHGGTWVADRFGTPNSAIHFDGESYVTAPGTLLPVGSAPRTVTAWVNPDVEGHEPYKGNAFTSWGNEDCVGKMFGLGNYLGNLSVWVGCADFHSERPLPLGVWSFVAVRWNPPQQMTVWVNGERDQRINDYVNTLPGNLWIGVESIDGGETFRHWYKGSLSHVRIYDRALTDEEIGLLQDPANQF
jgi:hypothetical protein